MKIYYLGEMVDETKLSFFPVIKKRQYVYNVQDAYEVIRVYRGKILDISPHYYRLLHSMNILGINNKYLTKLKMYDILIKVINSNNITDGILYFHCLNGNILCYIEDILAFNTSYTKGVTLYSDKDLRYLNSKVKSLNLIGTIQSQKYAENNNHFECLLYRENEIIETSHSNIFFKDKRNTIVIPNNPQQLNGTTKKRLLDYLKEQKIMFIERKVYLTEITNFTDCFITNVVEEITPVRHIIHLSKEITFNNDSVLYLQKEFKNYLYGGKLFDYDE